MSEISELVAGIMTKREECERNGGHIQPKKVGYIITTRIDPLRDRVTMLCTHCGTMYERPFDPEEVKEFCRFHSSLRDYRYYRAAI